MFHLKIPATFFLQFFLLRLKNPSTSPHNHITTCFRVRELINSTAPCINILTLRQSCIRLHWCSQDPIWGREGGGYWDIYWLTKVSKALQELDYFPKWVYPPPPQKKFSHTLGNYREESLEGVPKMLAKSIEPKTSWNSSIKKKKKTSWNS